MRSTIHIGTNITSVRWDLINEQKCFEWFQKAAEQGLVEAEYAVGGCYENELGVKQDYAQANYWYQIAVKDGHKRAAYDLGINYLKGQGMKKMLKLVFSF